MATWIAGFLGPIFVVLAVPMLVAPLRLQETTRRFLSDRPLVLVSGVLAMTAGLAIVKTHNAWRPDWTLIVTRFGWALVLGGAARIVAPGAVESVGGAMLERTTLTRIGGVFWALLGALLTFKADA